MTLQTLIVVANKFLSFAVDKQVVTLSQLDTILNLSKHVLPGRFQIIPGQGVSDDDIAELDARPGKGSVEHQCIASTSQTRRCITFA